MKTAHIRFAAAATVAATLALAAALHVHGASAVKPVQVLAHVPPPQHAGSPALQASQAVPQRQPWTAASADPFRSVSFAPPPPVPVSVRPPAPVAAEKPVAPPFPYRFFGHMVDVDGKTLTFLIRDGSLVPVQQGEVIDGNYRVDSASDTQLIITYLPLNEQSTLTLQSAGP